MGYKQRFDSEVSGSLYVTYPASEKGGGQTVHWKEPISVVVNVDDDPFNMSVDKCVQSMYSVGQDVEDLTKEQLEAKKMAADQISNSLSSGFLSYTKATYSQKMIEYQNLCTALYPQIKKFLDNLANVKTRMEGDFNKIKKTYVDVFQKLDDGLQRDMVRLNKPCFDLIETVFHDNFIERFTVATAGVLSMDVDINTTQSMLAVCALKKELRNIIEKLDKVVRLGKNLSRQCKRYVSSDGGTQAVVSFPVFILETDSLVQGQPAIECYLPSCFNTENVPKVEEKVLHAMQEGKVIFSYTNQDKMELTAEFQKLLSQEKDDLVHKRIGEMWNAYIHGSQEDHNGNT